MAGVGVQHWIGRFLLGVDAELGGLYERRRVEDAAGTRTDGRLQPAAGLTGRAGISILGAASLSFESGLRAHPDRLGGEAPPANARI